MEENATPKPRFPIAVLSFKSDSGQKDVDTDVRIDTISVMGAQDKNHIYVKTLSGFSFSMPAAVGIELNKLWHSYAMGTLENGIYHIPK